MPSVRERMPSAAGVIAAVALAAAAPALSTWALTGPVAAARAAAGEPSPNTLTAEERAQGWRLLWDGRTFAGWRALVLAEIPEDRWAVRDGTLVALVPPPGSHEQNADIVSERAYASFELRAEFRLSRGANSGIKYFVRTDAMADGGQSSVGFEYQLIDDQAHPDARAGAARSLASLYDVLPAAADKPTRPIGDWNEARILVRGRHVEHWLNGAQVLAFERGSEDFRARVAKSKHRVWPHYGDEPDGLILLQHHGGGVAFRNLRIRELAPRAASLPPVAAAAS